jgi:glyoxylase-like metal-dependent hydrolase (beta-lactamase superfamily II)
VNGAAGSRASAARRGAGVPAAREDAGGHGARPSRRGSFDRLARAAEACEWPLTDDCQRPTVSSMDDTKVREVYPGIFLIYLPLPMRPSIVNVYLVRSAGEWALFDTGVSTSESAAVFEAALKDVGCAPDKITKIVCTHHHPDHFGSSGVYRERTGAQVYLSRVEYESAQSYVPQRRSAAAVEFFIRNGIPLDRFVHVPSPADVWGDMYRPAAPDHFVEDGEVIRIGDLEVEVVTTPGHTAGHCVMYVRRLRVMIVGDHLLPKITPHVGIFPGGPTNPLGDFLRSQRKVQDFDVALVLPAHGGAYRDHRRRANQIIQHHACRMQEMLDLVRREARTAYDVARRAFGFDLEASLAVQFPATFETLAHLEYLRSLAKVVREERNGRIWYRATSAEAGG